MAKRKNNSVQKLIGFENFTKYGVKTDKAEIAFFSVEPTNISVLSAANIEAKIHHLMTLLSTIPDLEIIALDSCECFDGNKNYVRKRLEIEESEAIRKLLRSDYDFLDEIQTEMSSARRFMFGAITVRLITYMEAQLFSNFKAVKKSQYINKTVWTASVLFPISTLVLEIMFFESGHVTQFTLTFSVALIFLLNILVFYLYDSLALSYIKIAETAVLEKEKELYYNQCHIMQNSTKDLQAFRHDLNNQFAVISELLDAEQYDSVKTHVQGLLKKTGDKMIYSTTGHTPIDSIINYKLQSAVNDHIKVQTEVVVPMDLEIDISDIITIIGNLLDNSLYALKQLPEHKRTLTLKIMYNRERLFIQVSNPYLTKVQYENGEIITAKDDRQNHGFGLKNIEKAVEKYNGFMEINHENMTFTVDILLYLSSNN